MAPHTEELAHMNQPAIDLHGQQDRSFTEYLEIAVCAQHNNGGLGAIWWESNTQAFFPIGELLRSHGVYRPGGSALNSRAGRPEGSTVHCGQVW